MAKRESQKYINDLYKKRGYILDFHKVLAAEDFEFLKAYNEAIDAGYGNQRALDKKTKELLYIALQSSVKATVEQIKLHVKLALDYGATKREILEALEMVIPPAGVPAFMIGFEAWKQVVSPERIEPTVKL